MAATLLLAGCCPQPPRHESREAVQLQPDQLQWRSNPKVHALQTAVLLGDPSRPAPYVQRIKFPTNFRVEPHRHPNALRMVTVLSGTLYFAFGETFDESKLRAMPPGSFFTEPAGMAHYSKTGDEEVVLELHAVGPDGAQYVSPVENN